jgi:hypothetical protein
MSLISAGSMLLDSTFKHFSILSAFCQFVRISRLPVPAYLPLASLSESFLLLAYLLSANLSILLARLLCYSVCLLICRLPPTILCLHSAGPCASCQPVSSLPPVCVFLPLCLLPDSVRAEEKLPHFKRKLKGLVA